MSEVMIVDPKILPKSPKAFQEYVETYFVPRTILGKRCLVAGRSPFYDGYGSHGHKPEKGIAPSHSGELRRFKGGLPAGQELGQWIAERAEKGDGIWCLSGPSEPSSFDDED